MRACPSASSEPRFMSTPMRRTRSGCCARAVSGHDAALPRRVMNSRRACAPVRPHLMQDLKASTLRPECPLWVISRHVPRTSRCPLCANSGHAVQLWSRGRLRCGLREALVLVPVERVFRECLRIPHVSRHLPHDVAAIHVKADRRFAAEALCDMYGFSRHGKNFAAGSASPRPLCVTCRSRGDTLCFSLLRRAAE